jgi:polyketide cyclase/dehydrase/lipid transport protein
MRIATAFAAGAALLLSGLTAQALESSAKAPSTLSADALWAKVGDFCGIGHWHPAIEKCELSSDGKTRTLSLKGGGTIVETLVKWDAAGRAYTYAIASGPLPVANYTSTIAVAADGAGSVATWVGKYDAKGASDADAKAAIDGVYSSGLKGLTGN